MAQTAWRRGRPRSRDSDQFTIVEGKKDRRPDVLLFVTGLPLAESELKNPGDPAATAAAAVNQIQDYRDAIRGCIGSARSWRCLTCTTRGWA